MNDLQIRHAKRSQRLFLTSALATFLTAIVLGYSTSLGVLTLKIILMVVFVVLIYTAFQAVADNLTGHIARAFLAISLGVIFFVWALGYRFLPVNSPVDLWMQSTAGAVAIMAYSVIWKLSKH